MDPADLGLVLPVVQGFMGEPFFHMIYAYYSIYGDTRVCVQATAHATAIVRQRDRAI
jgi:hypothetical protein